MSWPHILSPDVIVYLSPIPERDGYPDHSVIAYPTVAEASNLKISDSHNGRYVPHTGKEQGAAVIKRQDTYKTGTGSRIGRAFDVISGTWSDNLVTSYANCYGLLQVDSSLSTTGELISNTTTSNIENCQIVLGRGDVPPVSAGSHTFTKNDTYFKIFLAWGSPLDLCITGEYGQPIRIDRTHDGWATYEQSSIADETLHTNKYLQHADHKIHLNIEADYFSNILSVELGDGKWLRTTAYKPTFNNQLPGNNPQSYPLPSTGKIRVLVANSYSTFEYYPTRYQTLNSKRRVELPQAVNHPNIGNAVVATNARTIANPDQNTTATADLDTANPGAIVMNMGATLPDQGDSLGSTTSPELVDATLIIPAVWTFDINGTIDTRPSLYMRCIHMEQTQEFNDVTRMLMSSVNLVMDNYDGLYNGFWGNRAVDIWSSTGNGYYKVFTGITGADEQGVVHFKSNTIKRISMCCQDFSRKMMTPIGQEITLDGMCIYNAVRLIGELCGIHPQYMQTIPLYVPPGCNSDAPYGPAGTDCPFPILAKGSGLNARYNYTEQVHGWDILQQLVQDTGQPISDGLSLPFYGGFRLDGQLIFEAYSPTENPPICFYNSQDNTGLAQLEGIAVSYSTAGMRSHIDFTGMNPYTNIPQYVHIEQPTEVKRAIGYPERWIERNPRYSGDYLKGIANTASAMSSLPTVVPIIEVPYNPFVSAGQRVLVYDETLGDVLDGYITKLHVTVGMADGLGFSGPMVADSNIQIRWIGNSPHI